MKTRLSVLFLTMLVSMIVVLGIPSYDERHEETAEEHINRILAECGYMFNAGTSGGAETMEEFER